jgi:hypothetical protein
LIQLNNLDIVETVAEFQSKGLTIVDFMKNYVNAQIFLKNSGVYIVGVCERYIIINDAESTQFTLFVVNKIECSTRCIAMELLEYEKVQTTGEM